MYTERYMQKPTENPEGYQVGTKPVFFAQNRSLTIVT